MTAIRKLLLDQQLGMLLRLGCRLLPRGRLVVILQRLLVRLRAYDEGSEDMVTLC